MKKHWLLILMYTLLISCFATSHLLALTQHEGTTLDSLNKKYLNWHNSDPIKSKIQGVAVESAYTQLLNGATASKKIIVAVIDSGVDIFHEDLEGKIWLNKGEIAGNGIDDDNNGYIDDMHGWNFIGNSKGENVHYENYEYVRMIRRMEPIYRGVESIDQLVDSLKNDYDTYLACKHDFKEMHEESMKRYRNIMSFDSKLKRAESVLKKFFGKDKFKQFQVENITSNSDEILRAKRFFLAIYKRGFNQKSYEKAKLKTKEVIDIHLNLDFQPRKIISDDLTDITDRNYGNNDVKCMRSDHGTFVAGIIAANRKNKIGIDGIAHSVEIMALRTVPLGDERDKDVALSIRYAVDNGANIINMSFGKNFSPYKSLVDDAIKYASDHNVLMIHASGNEALNLDKQDRYPLKRMQNGVCVDNWITVGATSIKANKRFCGKFSNYGQNNVDIFAPGVDMISLYPENKYNLASGTSFACPVVTGVAALVWSYYPNLSASDLKSILLESSLKYRKLKVFTPNVKSKKKKKVKFRTLSETGGIVNAFDALKLAKIFTTKDQLSSK